MTLFFDFAFLSRKEEHSWLLAAEFCTTTGHRACTSSRRGEEEKEEVARVLSPLDNMPSFGTNPVEDIL